MIFILSMSSVPLDNWRYHCELLLPIGQWDTDHGCDEYLMIFILSMASVPLDNLWYHIGLLLPIGQWDTDHGCEAWLMNIWWYLFYPCRVSHSTTGGITSDYFCQLVSETLTMNGQVPLFITSISRNLSKKPFRLKTIFVCKVCLINTMLTAIYLTNNV